MSRIFLSALGEDYAPAIAGGFRWLGEAGTIRPGTRVAIKPNLTFPTYREGVMTSPAAVMALLEYLKQHTDRITLCEADSGGYNRFSMDEVFRATGLADFANRLGVRVVNLSGEPSRPIEVKAGRHILRIPLPSLLLHDTDLFITMPVPKVHLNTGVSFGIKNQWGVIQEPALRLKVHPWFNEVVYAVNKAMPRTLVVMDGRFGLDRSGPLLGDPVRLDWLMVSDSLFHADLAAAGLIGVDWRRIPHLAYAARREGIASLDGVEWSAPPEGFRRGPFHLRRKWTDYPGVVCFNSRIAAWVGYESPLARPLHWLLYRFREPFY